MSRPRPWRAVATVSDWTSPTGARVAGHTAACSAAGLDRFRAEHLSAGHSVWIWEPLPEATPITPAGDPAPAPVA